MASKRLGHVVERRHFVARNGRQFVGVIRFARARDDLLPHGTVLRVHGPEDGEQEHQRNPELIQEHHNKRFVQYVYI